MLDLIGNKKREMDATKKQQGIIWSILHTVPLNF